MFKRIWRRSSRSHEHQAGSRAFAGRSRGKLRFEVLEARELLTASLAPLADVSVPALLGDQLPLDGSGSTSASQTFTATSSNPDIKVSVAQGQFWTLTVSHSAANSSDVTIDHETMTFQLFQDLTPNTVARITNLTNQNYFTQGFPSQTPPVLAGQFIPRITSVASSGFAAIQGGSSSSTSTASSSGIPSIATEPVQQLAFTGTNQIAMANTGAPNSSDAQFFITSAPLSTTVQQAFDFNYTIFGQLVAGQQTVNDLNKVAVTTGSSGENSQPINPVVINSVALSSQSPNGVLHIDTTGAAAGETATITVTATDPTDHTTATRTFTVTVGAYNGPTSTVTASTPINQPQIIQLQKTTPPTLANFNFTYQLLSQPAHGTVSQFNPTTGSLVYTPSNNYVGPDTLQYQVIAQASGSATKTAVSLGTVNLTVAPTVTGAVRVIGPVLVVDPVPRGRRFVNGIALNQVPAANGTEVIQVVVNGVLDSTQPLTTDLTLIQVFGSKTNDVITVDPSVTVPTTINGGTGGGKNVLRGGGGPTIENGWFGHTLLVGGTGANELVGRKGRVRFQPSTATALIYAGNANPDQSRHRPTPTGGTFYRFVKGRLVRV